MDDIKKILIANRGEIAVRIMRTCREMGIATVAVYSEADRLALFVQMADQAYEIGPAPSTESYLCVDKIIAAAKESGADAIHPGYGFLSEKESLSRACQDNGIVFLGPNPEAIAAMGDKITARSYAEKVNVPLVPGTLDPVSELSEIKKLAKKFGYPVLLKATAGGGGKGMRVVENEKDIESAFSQASSEAEKAFGDGRLYLEKYIKDPRHVEIQIACDQHGRGIHFLERECSMQRRHQKVIEEAPCPYLKDSVRQQMTAAALKLAKEIGYYGVGTVEFLVDQKQNFYFLEMNTRLQVEHSVTEKITGYDLVRLQIQIANGEKLNIDQDRVQPRGHSIECRIYAEDPENNFMPSPGKILWMRVPEGQGIRHDCGVYPGAEIPIYYDPMIAKLIVHAESREQAIAKMLCALKDYKIGGLKNNIGYLRTLLKTHEFQNATMHTQFIDQHPELTQLSLPELPIEVLLGVAALDLLEDQAPSSANGKDQSSSQWWKLGLEETLNQRM